ncbi:reverse transcriptase domain-containing protein [Tanacetum coccineum]
MRGHEVDRRRNDGRNTFNNRDGLAPYRPQAPYQAPRGDHPGQDHPRLNLNSLTKHPKEILASKLQLNLPQKGHYTKDCFQLKRQLESALESGKLNHLLKDVRQRGEEARKGKTEEKIRAVLLEKKGFSSRQISGGYPGVDGNWRMCIDFKNINLACPKDYYPLPVIDGKIESVMAEDDEEKTAFYTDQGTYCYMRMSFKLKNAEATYQRLVDTAFQSQMGRNLEAYVDDMAIKSSDEKGLISNIAETFDNLRRINMKLNPKKCSFGVEKGKFLGYMVTSEGIRANPQKMKAIEDMQSPRTLKEMQRLNGKLAAMNRFLSRSA